MAKEKKSKAESTTLECEFGAYSTGRKVVNISCKVSRTADLESYDELLTGAQLNVTLKCDPLADADAKGQQKLADTSTVVNGVADVHRISVGTQEIGFRLSFNRGDIDQQSLDAMAFCNGKLSAVRVGDANGKAEEGGDDNG